MKANGSVLIGTPLSMSCLPDEREQGPDADVARLVQLTLGGDTAAFEAIVVRYERRVMTLAVRLLGCRDEAPDVAQEVFLRAFKYLHRLDLGKPVAPWLMRITVNVCRDAARQRRRRDTTFVCVEPIDPIDRAPDPHAGLARKQEQRMLQQALESLPEKERLAIVLRDVEGLTTAEVAEILDSSETTVRSQISRGRLRLKTALDRLMGELP
jgi:RNA polymerase sigma-70 factor (ECF subfamily)